MSGRYYDLATESEIDLDDDFADIEELGYSRSLRQTSDEEWYSAQDPAYLERIRLDRDHGHTAYSFLLRGKPKHKSQK
jgi:hypothetical protein